jgi:hypothetical protein
MATQSFGSFYDELMPDSMKEAVIQFIPDTNRFKCVFEIRGETKNKKGTYNIYRISFDMAPGALYWTCSCAGNIRHGHCKHLKAMKLPGRAYGASHEWEEKLKNNNPFTGSPYGTTDEQGNSEQWKGAVSERLAPSVRKPNLRKPVQSGKKRRINFDEE